MKKHDNRRRAIIICIRENKLKLFLRIASLLRAMLQTRVIYLHLKGSNPTMRKSVQWKSCLPAPRNVFEVQTFLSFIQYQSDRSLPPRALLEKNFCLH